MPWRSWLRHCATSQKVTGSITDGVTGIFHWQSFWPHYGPGVDSVSNRNEYQVYFLGGKGGQCIGLTTLTSSCAKCLEILEPQPPETLRAAVQACNGVALCALPRLEWVVNAMSRLLYPRRKRPGTHWQKAGWGPGPVWLGAEILDPPPHSLDPQAVQPTASHYTDYTILLLP